MGQLRGMFAGKRVALILEWGFDAEGYASIRSCLESAGARVIVVSSDPWEEILDRRGSSAIKPDLSYSEAGPDGFDALMVADDASARIAKSRPDACALVFEAVRSLKPVAAIGEGVNLLICSDVLKGRKIAAKPPLADLIRVSGGMLKDRAVVIDANIISAKDAKYAGEVCKALADALRGLPAEAA